MALIALLPSILVGLALFVTRSDGGLSLPGWIGASASFAYGGSMGLSADVNAGVVAAQGSIFITSYSVTLALISGLLLFAGGRRVLRGADMSDLGSCLRRATPLTGVFIIGAVVLSALAGGATLPISGVNFALSPSLVRVFFMSALLVALAVGVALVSKARFAQPSLGRAWTNLSAPGFAIALLVFVVGAVAVLGGTIGVLVISGWEWGALALIPAGGLTFIEVALSGIALGTLSSLDLLVDPTAFSLVEQLSSGDVDLPSSGSVDVWTLFGDSMWVSVLVVIMVNATGIVAAAAMILRRRDASVARRDLGFWLAGFLVLALVMVVFVGFGFDIEAEIATLLGSASGSGAVKAGISASVVLLLPAFAAAWWFLARLILPRLPSATLTRLSDWARSGL